MQNDFLTGSLALRAAPAGQDGLEILEPLNAFLDEASDNFDKIGFSQGGVKLTPSSPRLRVGVILTDPESQLERLCDSVILTHFS